MNKLDGFEKVIKGSLDEFEVSFDPSMWTQMERTLDQSSAVQNQPDSFEKSIKESVEQHELPYDASQWTRLERSLSRKGGSAYKWFVAASIIGVVGGGIFLLSDLDSENKQTAKPVVAEDVRKTSSDLTITNGIDTVSQLLHSASGKDNSKNPQDNFLSENPDLPAIEKNEVTHAVLPEKSEKVVVNHNESTTNGSLVKQDVKHEGVVQHNESTFRTETLPTPEMIIVSEELCSGQEVSFKAGNVPSGSHCSWEINKNGAPIRSENLNYYFNEPGTYTISLTFIKENCKSASIEKTITVKPSPEADFKWNTLVENGKPFVHFTPDIQDVKSVKWTFNDGSVSTEKEPQRFYRSKGDYKVILTAEGNNGCISKTSQQVRVENDYNLFAPNAFSPNGDNTNNTFIPAALLVMDVEFTMTIYTRDGRLVYQTRSADRPWDGKFTSDNQLAPEGVYVWIVSIKGEEPYKGHVTLVK